MRPVAALLLRLFDDFHVHLLSEQCVTQKEVEGCRQVLLSSRPLHASGFEYSFESSFKAIVLHAVVNAAFVFAILVRPSGRMSSI